MELEQVSVVTRRYLLGILAGIVKANTSKLGTIIILFNNLRHIRSDGKADYV
jgi:predicted sugar kinase